jgi:hypothetical protein
MGSQKLAKVFPNPVNNYLTIQISEMLVSQVIYSVFDISGRKLNSGLVHSSRETVDFTLLPNGVYFIRLNNDQQQQIIKVVKD